MRSCSPAEFQKRWPGSLAPIRFTSPEPGLPTECHQLLCEFGLPQVLTISGNYTTTLIFNGSVTPLATIWKRDLQAGLILGEIPADWNRYWHLADQEYLQGSGWFCIEEITGRLVIIDFDQPDPVYLVNSSVNHFYTTLAYFLDWSETTGGSPAETRLLRDALRDQDTIPYSELEQFWMNFIDAALDGDPINFTVEVCPKK